MVRYEQLCPRDNTSGCIRGIQFHQIAMSKGQMIMADQNLRKVLQRRITVIGHGRQEGSAIYGVGVIIQIRLWLVVRRVVVVFVVVRRGGRRGQLVVYY